MALSGRGPHVDFVILIKRKDLTLKSIVFMINTRMVSLSQSLQLYVIN